MNFETFMNQITVAYEFTVTRWDEGTHDDYDSMFLSSNKMKMCMRIDFYPIFRQRDCPELRKYVTIWKFGREEIPPFIDKVPIEKINFDEKKGMTVSKEIQVSIFD